MIKKLMMAAFLLTNLLLAGTSYAALPGFSQVYYFGDSLTDIGNYVANYPVPCVEQSAPITNSVAQGGINAGQTWANINSQGFFATPSKLGGNDFAWASAQSGFQGMSDGGSPTQGLQNQVESYLARGPANPSALYVIWIGSNDILDFVFFYPSRHDPRAKTAAKTVQDGMVGIYRAMASLYNAGARNFLIIGVPDISQTPISSPYPNPSQLIGVLYGQGVLKADLSKVCNAWDNTLFNSTVSPYYENNPLESAKKSFPGINIYVYDPRPLLTAITTNPTAFGLPATIGGIPNNEQAYCKPGGSAADPDTYIFYNFIHPTSVAHTILAANIRGNALPF